MVLCYDLKSNGYVFINSSTGKQIGTYADASPFSDGVAVVKKNNEIFFIDKNAQEFHLPPHITVGDGYSTIAFSEGVIPAFDRNNVEHGYIYSPIGPKHYSYNQKGEIVNKDIWDRIFQEADELFEKQKYAQAMDKYYQCMNINPTEVSAFNNYSACLYNLGRYDEALTSVDITIQTWPNNDYATQLRSKIIDRMNKLENLQEDNNLQNTSYSIWDAIGNFANILSQASGTFVQSNAYTSYSYNTDINEVENHSSGYSENYLISQYSNWERLAEKHYNSLTNLGYSATSGSGNKSGSTGRKVSSGNYVQMKRSLREAQSNMRDIRLKARRQGINIQQSKWETARVNY